MDGYRAAGEPLGMADDHGILGHTANVEVRAEAAVLMDCENQNHRSPGQPGSVVRTCCHQGTVVGRADHHNPSGVAVLAATCHADCLEYPLERQLGNRSLVELLAITLVNHRTVGIQRARIPPVPTGAHRCPPCTEAGP